MLPNLSLVMEFLGIVFTTFIFEKLLSHEALVTGRLQQPVTIKCSFLSINEIICSSDIGSFDSFRKKFFPKLFHVLNHFTK